MVGSSTTGFPWTHTIIDIALNASLQVVHGGKDDPFKENNLVQVVSKLHARPFCSALTAPLQHVTTDNLRALLHKRRQRYLRVCELDDHPSVLRFSKRQRRIAMLPDQYASHIPVHHFLFDLSTYHFFCWFECSSFALGISRRRKVDQPRNPKLLCDVYTLQRCYDAWFD